MPIVSVSSFPPCSMCDPKCFAFHEGLCRILIDTNFNGKDCPFRKTNEQVEQERKDV